MALPPLFAPLRLPVIAAPMFIISGPELVVAQCKAGVVGSFPALNARGPGALDAWLARIKAELAAHDAAHPGQPAAPFAVNLIVHKSNTRHEEDLATIARHKVPLVITSLGARAEVNAAVHGWGGLVLHDVTTNSFARKAIAKGADGLILVAAGAGGHAGTLSPFALAQEVRAWFDGPLALSGAIACGRSVLGAQALGADFAYIGSAWIATAEANAAAAYQQAIVDCAAEDITYTNLFTGIHGNYLRPSIIAAGLDPDHLPTSDPSQMDFAAATSTTAAKAWKDIWGAGQGIGAVHAITSVAERVATLAQEYQQARAQLAAASAGFAV